MDQHPQTHLRPRPYPAAARETPEPAVFLDIRETALHALLPQPVQRPRCRRLPLREDAESGGNGLPLPGVWRDELAVALL